MTYAIYILYSEKDHRLYVGHTNNLSERIYRHNAGFVSATQNRRPLVCIHSEMFATRSEAMKRELFLKSLWGARIKKKILKKYLEEFQA